jgi:hypothetical protein
LEPELSSPGRKAFLRIDDLVVSIHTAAAKSGQLAPPETALTSDRDATLGLLYHSMLYEIKKNCVTLPAIKDGSSFLISDVIQRFSFQFYSEFLFLCLKPNVDEFEGQKSESPFLTVAVVVFIVIWQRKID